LGSALSEVPLEHQYNVESDDQVISDMKKKLIGRLRTLK
jgi:hypothetical protein